MYKSISKDGVNVKKKKKNRIYFLRTTSIVNDSRTMKEINTLSQEYKVKILGWDRQGIINKKESCLNAQNLSSSFFRLKCNYGGGTKNLLKMMVFELWLLFQLVVHKNDYDIIHSCDLDTGLIARIVCKIFNKKMVYDIFDYYVDAHKFPKKISNFLESQEVKTINFANLILICTEQRRKQITKAKPKKVIVIHNTPDLSLDFSDIRLKGDRNKVDLVYFGVLQEDRLLKEIGEEIKNNKYVNLHIGGFGKYEDYFKKMSENTNNIYYYGSLKYNEVLCLEEQADIIFATYNPKIPNHNYSAPNKFYEAIALGKPIIVCKNMGIDELVKKDNLGKIIDYSAKEFLKAVLDLKKEKFCGVNSKEVYHNHYSWDIMKKRLQKSYKDLFE